MQAADNEFFEEYKKLDNLCTDMFSCEKNGVSAYISEMENSDYRIICRIPSWDDDYDMLKHVRHVRNALAHESFSYRLSNSEDIKFVKDFYSRIFAGKDALSLLRKESEKLNRQRKQQKKNTFHNTTDILTNVNPSENSKSYRLIDIIFAIGIAILIIFIIAVSIK